MKKGKLLSTLITCSLVGTVAAGWASQPEDSSALVRGSLSVEDSTGQWANSRSIPTGRWVRANQADATIKIPGATLRLNSKARIRLHSTGQLEARGGKVFFKVDSPSGITVLAHQGQIQANRSEFVLDAEAPNPIYVLDGDARVLETKPQPRQKLESWRKASRQIALDGPDVRQRNKNKNRKRFVQGEENKGKTLVEEPSPLPSMTQTPAYTPTPPPPVPPTPPPPTPPTPPEPVVTGGSPWPLIGGLVGLGGIIALVARGGNTENPIIPASP